LTSIPVQGAEPLAESDWQIEIVIPGDETDNSLKRALREVMRELGAKLLDRTGSSLSITGDEHDVDEIARRVAEVLKLHPTTADYRRQTAPGNGH
jgi:hypothetical protein